MGLPVDTHVYRVSVRLAFMPPDAQFIHDFHKDLLRHGQRICVYGTPRCWECPLTDLCDYYKTVVQPK